MEIYEEGKVYYSKKRIRRFVCEDCNYCWEEIYEEEDLIYDEENIQEIALVSEEDGLICPMCGSPNISQL
jgi:transposase-like protein